MKYFITTIFLITSLIGKSQSSLLVNDKLPIDSLYENVNENLILSKVLEFEGLKKEELKTKVKNWGSTKFVNLKEILVSETEDQIVLNYIDKSYFYKVAKYIVNNDWYVRLVIQFKDGKIRCQYYEDGNVFIPSQYGVPSTESRTFYFKQFFEEENGILYSKKLTKLGFVSFKESIISNLNSLREEILKKDTSKEW